MSLRSIVKYWRHEHWEEDSIDFFRESVAEAFKWWGWTSLAAVCVVVGGLGWFNAGHEATPVLLFAVIAVPCIAALATAWLGMMLFVWLSAVCGRLLLMRMSAR